MADELDDDQLDYQVEAISPGGEELSFSDLEEVQNGKRKGHSQSNGDLTKKSKGSTDGQPQDNKRRKNNEGLKEKKAIRMQIEVEQKQHLGKLEPAIIADFVTKKLKLGNKELSGVELQDKGIPENSIVNTSDFTKERNLETLPDFMRLQGFIKPPKDNKLILVLSMSAIRVCDVSRTLRKIGNGALKLITKNKAEYDRKALASSTFIAVSTPGRVRKLESLKLLNLNRIALVIVDSAFLDVKKNNVWDLPETIPLLSELSHDGKAVFVF